MCHDEEIISVIHFTCQWSMHAWSVYYDLNHTTYLRGIQWAASPAILTRCPAALDQFPHELFTLYWWSGRQTTRRVCTEQLTTRGCRNHRPNSWTKLKHWNKGFILLPIWTVTAFSSERAKRTAQSNCQSNANSILRNQVFPTHFHRSDFSSKLKYLSEEKWELLNEMCYSGEKLLACMYFKGGMLLIVFCWGRLSFFVTGQK